MAIKTSGQIIRSSVGEVPPKGRDTMGVKFVHVDDGDSVSVIALYPDNGADEPENGTNGEESTQADASDTVAGDTDPEQPTD